MAWTTTDEQVRRSLEIEWAALVDSWVDQGRWVWPPDGDDDGGDDGGGAGLPTWVTRCARHDDQAWALVLVAAQQGDPVAGRLGLQAMLPALISMSARDRRRSFGDYLSAAWLRLISFPVERRPHKVLTNLVLDTLKSVTREGDLRQCPQPPDWFACHNADLPEVDEPAAASVITAAAQLGLIDAVTEPVLRSVYTDGLSGKQAASRHHQSPAMVRYRCSRAIHAMRAARVELYQAA